MKLLIVTQILDCQDPNLGFFHRWVREFAKHCEKITVICLLEGEHDLPQNVSVLSLGKETGTSRIKRTWRFLNFIYTFRGDYDAVLVHMNPEYVLLGGVLWRLLHKKSGLWYAHRSVTKKLVYATRLADRIFTSSAAGFRLKSAKVRIVGQGIDTDLFTPQPQQHQSAEVHIITTGRITESKHLLEMLAVLDALHKKGELFTLTIVGVATSPAEERYAARLIREIAKRPFQDKIHLVGAVPNHRLPSVLSAHDLFLNFSSTGSLDKAVLEALACGIPVLTTNSAFDEMLTPYGLYVSSMEGERVAGEITSFLNRSDRKVIATTLRNSVIEDHSLQSLIPKILTELQYRAS